MRGAHLIAVLFAQAGPSLGARRTCAPRIRQQHRPSNLRRSPAFATPANQPPPAIEPAQPQTNPVLASIRAKLADPPSARAPMQTISPRLRLSTRRGPAPAYG